jgi:DNA-binding response OmpR family regulator
MSQTLPHIAVVDDEAGARDMVGDYLRLHGFQVSLCDGGAALRKVLGSAQLDLVVLDLNMPEEDGLSVMRHIKQHAAGLPVIMRTATASPIDRIVGLEIGADDYIPKPFHLREVLARLRTVLRRRQPAAAARAEAGEAIHFDGWRLDLGRRQLITAEGTEIILTTGEFDMLAALARHPGRVLSRDLLMDLTHGRSLEAFDRTVDAQIARLRKKIEPDPKQPTLIKSVRGIGYVFTGKPSS